MTDLSFRIDDVVAEPYAAAPQLTARLQVSEASGTTIHAIALRCQIRIEPQRRPYTSEETIGLVDQFGTRDRWSQTLKPFLWMQCSTMVQGFDASTMVDVPMPVTYDLEVTASKYFHSLEAGEVPLVFLFSGTVFTRGTSGFGVEQVAWHLEDSYRMPVSVWRDCMQMHFANAGWLRLDHDTLIELAHYKAAHGLTTWDEVVGRLLHTSRQDVR
ncbi:MAG: DUF6084 family protein [Nocardioidaceae bacterium]